MVVRPRLAVSMDGLRATFRSNPVPTSGESTSQFAQIAAAIFLVWYCALPCLVCFLHCLVVPPSLTGSVYSRVRRLQYPSCFSSHPMRGRILSFVWEVPSLPWSCFRCAWVCFLDCLVFRVCSLPILLYLLSFHFGLMVSPFLHAYVSTSVLFWL
jgi:hypothetical protein